MRHLLSHIQPRNPDSLTCQIHYLFACSRVGRPLVPFLRELGLNCTEPQSDRPQGTVSTLIFWENVYLELFWFDEKSHLAQSDMSAEFNFTVRANWLKTRASPFGLSLCYPTDDASLSTSSIKAIKTERSPSSAQLLRILPSTLANPEVPICRVVPDYVATDERLNKFLAIPEQIGTQTQTLGMRKLTHSKLRVTSDRPSCSFPADRTLPTPLLNLAEQNVLNIEPSQSPLLELIFDDRKQKRSIDLRPLLPMVMRY